MLNQKTIDNILRKYWYHIPTFYICSSICTFLWNFWSLNLLMFCYLVDWWSRQLVGGWLVIDDQWSSGCLVCGNISVVGDGFVKRSIFFLIVFFYLSNLLFFFRFPFSIFLHPSSLHLPLRICKSFYHQVCIEQKQNQIFFSNFFFITIYAITRLSFKNQKGVFS